MLCFLSKPLRNESQHNKGGDEERESLRSTRERTPHRLVERLKSAAESRAGKQEAPGVTFEVHEHGLEKSGRFLPYMVNRF